jgi:hypothetical protein
MPIGALLFCPVAVDKPLCGRQRKFATFSPDGSARMSGLAPRLPITITLFTDMTTNLLVR